MRTRPLLAVAVPVLSIALAAGSVLAGQEQAKPQVPVRPRDAGAPQTGTPQNATGLLAGMLIAADTGKPVRRASVSLMNAETLVRKTVTTDELGRFSFDKLQPGAYNLSANRAGYLDVTYGQRTPGSGRPGTAIQLVAGQRLENVSLRMPRTGILTGVINDEFGDPAMGIQVQAWRWVKRSGERTLQSAGYATTDDRGIWRMAGLIPGEYVVGTVGRDTSETMYFEGLKLREVEMVEARLWAVSTTLKDKMAVEAFEPSFNATAPKIGYASVYYPGTLQSAAATAVTLGISEERSGVDVQLQAVALATVSGSVIGPDGGLPPGGQVRLVETNALIPGFKSYSSPIRNDGTFTINGVPPGQYTLLARTNSRVMMRLNGDATVELQAKTVEYSIDVAPARKAAVLAEAQAQANAGGAEALWGQSEISVDDRPLTNVVLQLQRGFDVSGSYAFEGTPPQPPDLSRLRFTLTPASAINVDAGQPQPASIAAPGRFTLRGVTPGRYRLNATGLPAGWTLKSAMFGGRDVLDTMLDVKGGDELTGGIVTFTNRSSELSGSLQDQSGKPVGDYTIVVFPVERRFWTPQSRRIQAMRPSTDGKFNFRNLPPGEYQLTAVVDPEPGDWFDPAFLDQLLGGAVPVSIGEGERKVQDVRIVR
jgi:hypothetical protein